MRVRLKIDRLRDTLARSSRSQNAWAMRVGLSRGHWSEIVNGKHPYPSAKTRRLILEGLGVDFDELFEVDGSTGDDGASSLRAALARDYVVDHEVGSGAMGVVYLARDRKLGRQVAIKAIGPEAAGGLGADRLLREIARVARLQHPNVLPLLDAGTASGWTYHVTPFVADGSLRDRLAASRESLTVATTIAIVRGIAAALAHAHGRDVLHCDVKPENVILAGDHPYLADFGVARAVHVEALREWPRRPDIDTAAGTPAYVSPEQARAELDLDPRSDVFSLACVAFEMLAGRPPFDGGTTTEVVKRRFDALPPRLADAAPAVPPPIAAVVAEAMSPDKRYRPADAVEFAARLELAAIASDPARAQRPRTRGTDPRLEPSASGVARSAAAALGRWVIRRTRPRPRRNTLESILEDVRISIRSLARRPLFGIITVLTLALGIGANTAMFSVVHAAVLRPLPFAEPERLARIYSSFEGRLCCTVSAPNFVDMRRQTTLFDDLVAYGGAAVAVTGEGDAVRRAGYRVSSGFFELLGARPQTGRFITADDDTFGAEPVVVLSDGLWRDGYGADPGIVGRSLTIDSIPHTIIGIAPPGFRVTGRPEVFLPFAWDADNMPPRGSNSLFVIGRTRAEVTLDAAMGELDTIYARLVDEYPDVITNRGVAALTIDEWLVGTGRRRPLLVLWGAVGMVLLVACANVVNLMLARSEARQRELAVRAALGAGRGRLVRHFLSESLLVALIGAAAGVAIAWLALRSVLGVYGQAVPRGDEVGINGAVLLFTVGVAIATGLLSGIVPALQSTSARLQTALRDGGRGATGGRGRLRQGLVVIEVAAALILVIGAGLMLKSFWRLNQVDVGVDPARVLSARISLPAAGYADQATIQAFFEDVRAELDGMPPVEAAGYISATPFSGAYINFSRITPEGEPERAATFVESRTIDDGFFATMGLDIVAGRAADRSDPADTDPVVVVNQELARQLFPDLDPVGRNLVPAPGSSPWRIVGVVENVREHGPERAVPPTIYFSALQGNWSRSMTLTVRSADDPRPLSADIRRIVGRLDPDLPVYSIETLDGLIDAGHGARRFNMSLLSTFAGLALLLGAIGIYGVMAYTVEQRTREIGLRQALGASPGSVLGRIVSQGLLLALTGIAVGVAGALLLRNVVASLLYEVSSLDAWVYVSVAAILATVATLACLVPGWRAANVDPMRALCDQ